MNQAISGPAIVTGVLAVPPDKSICHRVVLLAALSEGTTTLGPWPQAEDCQRTKDIAQALGAQIVTLPGNRLSIRGVGRHDVRTPESPLDCGESGTTFRLAAGVLAGQPFSSTLQAAPSLARRPMRRIIEPLIQMGAYIEGTPGQEEIYPPLQITGKRPLRAIRYTLPIASAQVKSAVLLAGLFADGPTTVVEPSATRDHTERLLKVFGVPVSRTGNAITVVPTQPRSPGELTIPGDISSAAFFLVAAAAQPGSELTILTVGLNPTRDGFLQVLREMGADIRVEAKGPPGEQFGNLVIKGQRLRGVTVKATQVPGLIDELPILMVAATQAVGRSRFEGVRELRVKETDRMASMLDGLRRLGAAIDLEGPDTVVVEGGRPLRGAVVEGAGDHRTVMSLAVAALAAQGQTVIRGAECVAKSFPDFFERLRGVTGSSTVKTVDKT